MLGADRRRAGDRTPRERHALELCSDVLRLELEAAELRAEVDALRARLAEIDRGAEEKSDEVLKLSEALFAQDIELLRNNERLGQIEKLKNDFIEKMSRELRTPLNGIIEAIIAVLAGENDVLSETAQQTPALARSTTAPPSCARSRTSSTSGASSRARCPSRSRT